MLFPSSEMTMTSVFIPSYLTVRFTGLAQVSHAQHRQIVKLLRSPHEGIHIGPDGPEDILRGGIFKSPQRGLQPLKAVERIGRIVGLRHAVRIDKYRIPRIELKGIILILHPRYDAQGRAVFVLIQAERPTGTLHKRIFVTGVGAGHCAVP